MAMSFDVYEFSDKLTYKPGYDIRVDRCLDGAAHLKIMATLPDSRQWDKGELRRPELIPVISRGMIELAMLEYKASDTKIREYLLQRVYLAVSDFEEHEAREWLRYDGKRVKGVHGE